MISDRRSFEIVSKSPGLIFSALVGDDGTHNVRFERAHFT